MSLLEKIQNLEKSDRVNISFEYFAPKTEIGIMNLNQRIARMRDWNPVWVDVTWGAGGKTGGKTLEICDFAKNMAGVDVNMHLTCTNMPKAQIDGALQECKKNGIKNILAIRGDKPFNIENLEEGCFAHATDLVTYIRQKYGDHFCVSVAGYPEIHPESTSFEDDIYYVQKKLELGADFIITQLFLDAADFLKYVQRCREAGIKCPIIPGIMPFTSFQNYSMVVKLSAIKVPKELESMIMEYKGNDEKIKEVGIMWATKLCEDLIKGGVKFLHFYTMNQEYSTGEVLKNLNLLQESKPLPFQTHCHGERSAETVRPIFWANRKFSYIQRTKDWDEFPNGRWGRSGAATFKVDDEYPSFGRNLNIQKHFEKLKEEWGNAPTSLEQICQVFVNFVIGKIKHLPWSQGYNQIKEETKSIEQGLLKMNLNGLLTTNSQPRIFAVPSSDKIYGWGPPGGYVFQKAYLEFFCPSKLIQLLIEKLKKHPNLTYQAVNFADVEIMNCDVTQVNAVTWGVFPGEQVHQPTVVDHQAFLLWKQEAYSLWITEWKKLYASESPSAQLIQKIHDDYFLVNICDNDFVKGDLDQVMGEFIVEHQETIKAIFEDFKITV